MMFSEAKEVECKEEEVQEVPAPRKKRRRFEGPAYTHEELDVMSDDLLYNVEALEESSKNIIACNQALRDRLDQLLQENRALKEELKEQEGGRENVEALKKALAEAQAKGMEQERSLNKMRECAGIWKDKFTSTKRNNEILEQELALKNSVIAELKELVKRL